LLWWVQRLSLDQKKQKKLSNSEEKKIPLHLRFVINGIIDIVRLLSEMR
jgi:hypothetical protein